MTGMPLSFAAHQTAFVRAMREALRESDAAPEALHESAFPAYIHANPLARWLFWARIRRTRNYIRRLGPLHRALDFGCGSGVMLPLLSEQSESVVGYDIDLQSFHAVSDKIALPANVEVTDRLPTVPGSLDLILALDVLEHVDDLAATLDQLARLLRPGGHLLVSGPTENWLYRLGRRLAGRVFTGHYHVRDIYGIRAAMEARFTVRCEATLYHPIPLFQLYSGTV